MDSDGKMDRLEFSIAMKLIKLTLQGRNLPSSLPIIMKQCPVSGSTASITSAARFGKEKNIFPWMLHSFWTSITLTLCYILTFSKCISMFGLQGPLYTWHNVFITLFLMKFFLIRLQLDTYFYTQYKRVSCPRPTAIQSHSFTLPLSWHPPLPLLEAFWTAVNSVTSRKPQTQTKPLKSYVHVLKLCPIAFWSQKNPDRTF